ncbi:metallophosphoesterase [candidate division KSB1 bacterium]|nr:metallophosphoesterase [candidate division KSB1 bacterium]
MVKSLIRKKQRVSQFVLPFRIPVLIGLYFFSAPASAYLQNSYFESTTSEVQKPQSTKFKFNGEYGLWVREHENQIEVNWITTEEDSGFLKVFKNGIQLYDVITESARSHRAAFDAIEESVLALQYGNFSSQADRHETIIELNKKETKNESVFTNIDSIYVLGDIHGRFDILIKLLQNARVIDSNLNWIANQKHLVALGDIFDRGQDVTRTVWFLYKLERQAKEQGGRVHLVLGNHEIMTFGNDLRYLSGKEKLIANIHNISYSEMYSPRHSILGKWLAQKPGILKINKALFAHGGITPDYNAISIQAFNDSLKTFLQEDVFNYLVQDSIPTALVDSLQFYKRLAFFYSSNSVFWYRAYVGSDTLAKDLKKVLKNFKSNVHIVAHTPVRTIREFYDGKIVAVDLADAATEMLLLVRRDKNKFKRFKVMLDGKFEQL